MGRRKWKQEHTTKSSNKEVTLRSGFEKKVAVYLDDRDIEYLYEAEKLDYEVPAKRHSYTPDFKLPNGIYIEAKGKWDAASRQKMAHVIEQNPDKDIRMLFMRDNPISKTSKTKYSDWAEKRGIKYHVSADGEVPEAWLEAKPKTRIRRKKLDD